MLPIMEMRRDGTGDLLMAVGHHRDNEQIRRFRSGGKIMRHTVNGGKSALFAPEKDAAVICNGLKAGGKLGCVTESDLKALERKIGSRGVPRGTAAENADLMEQKTHSFNYKVV